MEAPRNSGGLSGGIEKEHRVRYTEIRGVNAETHREKRKSEKSLCAFASSWQSSVFRHLSHSSASGFRFCPETRWAVTKKVCGVTIR